MMTTLFPEIRHIDDVLPAIEGRREFLVAEKPHYVAVDYNLIQGDTFGDLSVETDPAERASILVRRECRGIKFDRESGDLISRPYHKFFNLGESREAAAVDWTADHVVLDKLDGSMVAPTALAGELLYLTRISSAGVAAAAHAHARTHTEIGYDGFSRACLADGLQPIFEWCSPDWRIVVDYPEASLVLTAVREMTSGAYRPMDEIGRLARPHGIPVVPVWSHGIEDPAGFVAHARDLEGEEGYVVRFADGRMVKLKAEAYVARHRALSNLENEKHVLRLVLDEAEDDLVPLLPPDAADAIRAYAAVVRSGMAAAVRETEAALADSRARYGEDRKAFAQKVAPSLDPGQRHVAFALMDGKDGQETLAKLVRKNTKTGDGIDRVRSLIGNATWTV